MSSSANISPDLLNSQLKLQLINRMYRWIGQDQSRGDFDSNIMDYIHHFDQTDHLHDLLFQLSATTTSSPEDNPLQILCDDHFKDQIMKSDHRRPRKQPITFGVNDDNNPTDSKKRKIMHRDIERQRRQEMATLYRALRSLLPLEYLKGKRSISDHMHQAVKYIKHLQARIQELGEKRDKLQRFSTSSTASFASEWSQSHHPEDCVTVRSCLVGVEVVVNTTALRQGLPLSRVLEILIREGLNIVNCITTKMNERLLHTIESEVGDGGSIDLCELQQKIMKLAIPGLN